MARTDSLWQEHMGSNHHMLLMGSSSSNGVAVRPEDGIAITERGRAGLTLVERVDSIGGSPPTDRKFYVVMFGNFCLSCYFYIEHGQLEGAGE
mmetsp:Transcript_13813/g.23559  ORF Transcript_13813/g.23559 Transcript_13813/m.23559 type:complete len:93 (+) Transcript_13813:745-1023(+)